jgi:hypothetical protein
MQKYIVCLVSKPFELLHLCQSFFMRIYYFKNDLIQSFSHLELSLLFFDFKSEIHIKIHCDEGSWFCPWLVGVKEISDNVSYLLVSRVAILQYFPPPPPPPLFFFFFLLGIFHLLDY